MNNRKLLAKLLANSLRNVRFSDFQKLLKGFGFRLSRTVGSHHIYTHSDISEIVNLQNIKGQAKPYQIRQVLNGGDT